MWKVVKLQKFNNVPSLCKLVLVVFAYAQIWPELWTHAWVGREWNWDTWFRMHSNLECIDIVNVSFFKMFFDLCFRLLKHDWSKLIRGGSWRWPPPPPRSTSISRPPPRPLAQWTTEGEPGNSAWSSCRLSPVTLSQQHDIHGHPQRGPGRESRLWLRGQQYQCWWDAFAWGCPPKAHVAFAILSVWKNCDGLTLAGRSTGKPHFCFVENSWTWEPELIGTKPYHYKQKLLVGIKQYPCLDHCVPFQCSHSNWSCMVYCVMQLYSNAFVVQVCPCGILPIYQIFMHFQDACDSLIKIAD